MVSSRRWGKRGTGLQAAMVQGGPLVTAVLLRAAEPKREYISETRAAPPQAEILRTPQADLFE